VKSPAAKALADEFRTAQFPNGFRVIHKQVDRPVTHLGLVINAGSRDELAGESGAAHFIEHTLFKGTKKRKAYHVLNRLDSVGGEVNAYTSKEDTWLVASFLPEHLERALELLADITFDATFPEREVLKERDVILDELHSYWDSPVDALFDEFEERLFAGHPLAGNILGTEDSVGGMTRERLLGFVDRHYATEEMVLSVVGPVPWDRLLRLAERYFGQSVASQAGLVRTPFVGNSPFDVRLEKDVHQVHHILGAPTVGHEHPDRVALAMLANLLGGPTMNSRLSLNIRERHGMAYNIECAYTPYTDSGVFSVYFGTDAKSHARAERLVLKEFALLRDRPLGDRQLRELKRQVLGHIALSQDSGHSVMTSLGKSFLLYNQVESLEKVFESIEQVTAADLQRLAQSVLQPEGLSHLVYRG
jgi:predicted Zn-dependent peptidase